MIKLFLKQLIISPQFKMKKSFLYPDLVLRKSFFFIIITVEKVCCLIKCGDCDYSVFFRIVL